jgi:hypothetical protein
MTLTGSGLLTFSNINVELGRNATASISIGTAAGGGYGAINKCGDNFPSADDPDTVSEWYSYNHTFAITPTYLDPGGGTGSADGACSSNVDCSTAIYYKTSTGKYFSNNICTSFHSSGYYVNCSPRTTWIQLDGSGNSVSSGTCTTTTTAPPCYTFTVEVTDILGNCLSFPASGATYSSNTATLSNGVKMYSDSICTTVAANVYFHTTDGGNENAWGTDGSGFIDETGICA